MGVTPALLAWQDITFTVQEKQKGKGIVQKKILDQVSGFAAPGTLTAILGASGSGKSSLLSAIAERLPRAKAAKLGTSSIKKRRRLLKLPSPMHARGMPSPETATHGQR